MSGTLLSRGFCLVTRGRYLLLKLMEAMGLYPHERAETTAVARITRQTLRRGCRVPAEEVLLLLPHCLQHHDCPRRITACLDHCVRCGKCPVGELADLASEMGLQVQVATGGTLARRHLLERRPSLVVAVACPRDLAQGMLDALPLPSLGILNRRPHGDCYDTEVSVEEVRRVLDRVLSTGEGCNPSAGTG